VEERVTFRRRRNRPRNVRRLPGVVAVAGWLALLLAALSLVTWRQSRGIEMEAALRAVESERAIAEAERVTLTAEIEELRSRARVIRVATERLGMKLPADSDIIFLQVQSPVDEVVP
jgi:cell division protein FtsL